MPKRPLATTLTLAALWTVFYGSFTLVRPALLDDADSVHAEVAREMLLRHDWVTLYANGIRYLEKAPLLYWSMAGCMRVAQALGHGSAGALAVAARVPLALSVLALAFAVEAFARRSFGSPQHGKTGVRAGLYAGLILLSSFGIFLFTRITIPDAMVCLWLTLAMLCFWLTESGDPSSKLEARTLKLLCYGYAACCALGVLTKGLIGMVFPVAIAAIYLVVTRGLRGAVRRVGELHPVTSAAVFLAIAAPWHVLIALANPAQGHPGGLGFALHGSPHWTVPLPADGNVHGWAWFYFVNEQMLRYLDLRIPRDYDTVPLGVFWGLCFVWMMPWSAFGFKAVGPVSSFFVGVSRDLLGNSIERRRGRLRLKNWGAEFKAMVLLALWGFVPLVFFSFSTRQEYYVLPSLPPLSLLIARILDSDSRIAWQPNTSLALLIRRANIRCTGVLLAFGTIFAGGAVYFLLHMRRPAADADLASLLQQNPGDYAMSMGHFLDLNAQALGLFRVPLAIAALSLFMGPLVSLLLRRRAKPHAATLALAAGAFGFLLAAHLGLRIFAPVLSSQQLAAAIAPQVRPDDLIVLHQEYEYGSTLGFYLQRPSYAVADGRPVAVRPIHILTDASYHGTVDYGRSSNLWYGSFFADAPRIFETAQTLAERWPGAQRIFVWQDLGGQPSALPQMPGPVYVIARSGGKEIVSNQPTRP